MHPDTGDAAPDNPAIGNPDPRRRRIVAYGLRNPFRFTFRPGTGEIWSGDVGWNTDEEINRTPDVTQVRNYGWPCYEGATRQGSYDSLNLASCETLYSAGTATTPYYSYKHTEKVVPGESCSTGSSSISGLAFYTADVFPPAYKNALFFSDYSRNCIWVMYRGANGLPDPATRQTFLAGAAGPVFLTQGPDGALYYADLVGREDPPDRRRQLDADRAHRRQPDLRHRAADRRLQRHGLERPRVAAADLRLGPRRRRRLRRLDGRRAVAHLHDGGRRDRAAARQRPRRAAGDDLDHDHGRRRRRW